MYITLTSYFTDVQERTCLALQVKRPSSLPTVRDQTDIVKQRRNTKLEALAFDTRIMSHSDAMGCDTTTATPCAQNSSKSPKD